MGIPIVRAGILGEDLLETSRKKFLALLDDDLKAEAKEILLQAFARREPWAVEVIRGK